jgi:hypothetical protein
MKGAVFYKNTWLLPNSEAYQLYHSKDEKARQKLDKHLKDLDVKQKELLQRYAK